LILWSISTGAPALVRVRRLKHNAYRVGSVRTSCAKQIREFRELSLPDGVGRELWVRGPEQAWHWYRILPDTIEIITEIPNTGPSTGETGTGEENGLPGQIPAEEG